MSCLIFRREAPSWARPRAERAVSRLVRLGVAAVALATVACAWDALPDGGGAHARLSSHAAANDSALDGSATAGAVGGAAAGARAAIFYFLGPHAFFASVWVTLQVRCAARARAHARRSAVGTPAPRSRSAALQHMRFLLPWDHLTCATRASAPPRHTRAHACACVLLRQG